MQPQIRFINLFTILKIDFNLKKLLFIMKKLFSLALFLLLSVANLFSQIPLIGENAPSFTAETTKGTLNFPTDYKNCLLEHL